MQLPRHGVSNKRARFIARRAARQMLVVPCVHMSDVSSDRKCDGLRFELLGGSGPADPTRVLLAGVFGNRLLLLCRASRK